MKSPKDMTFDELKVAAKRYQAGALEGGEGFNPYVNELTSERVMLENKKRIEDEIAKEWTLEITKARREEFNSCVKSGKSTRDLGYTKRQLVDAVLMWGL